MMISQALVRTRFERRRSPILPQLLALLATRPLLSVLLSILGFSFLGPIAALILVATMLDHEFAHAFVMRRLGYQPGPVRIIPLMGAYVRAGTPMLRTADIALIYLAGPLVGVLSATSVAAVAALLLDPVLQHQVFVGAAVAVALNLFNLMPIEPLDGGLITRIVPYPALLLFPIVLTILLAYTHLATSPLGLTVLLGASVITVRKVLKWRRYLATIRQRVSNGDLAALRELRANFEVPFTLRVTVMVAYLALIPISITILALLLPAGILPH